MGEDASRVQPIFISIDPMRDTVEIMADYVSAFHPRLVGLTGTARQAHRAAKAYYVHYARVKYKGEILVDHTADTYLTGPDGKFLMDFSHGTDPREIAAGILQWMNKESSTSAKGQIQ